MAKQPRPGQEQRHPVQMIRHGMDVVTHTGRACSLLLQVGRTVSAPAAIPALKPACKLVDQADTLESQQAAAMPDQAPRTLCSML